MPRGNPSPSQQGRTFRRYAGRRYAGFIHRKWKRLLLLALLGIAIGTAEVALLRNLYGIPSLQSFLVVALLLAIGDFLFAWGVERSTRREGPEVWNSLVGRQAEVISAPAGRSDQKGLVRVAGETWKARCRSGASLAPGDKVLVTARDRLVLEVEPRQPPARAGSGSSGAEQLDPFVARGCR